MHQRIQTHSPDELDATLGARVFEIALQSCPKCGGTPCASSLKAPLLRIHAPLHITEPALIAQIPSNIGIAVMISGAEPLRVVPGHRLRSRCIKFYIRFQGVEGAVAV